MNKQLTTPHVHMDRKEIDRLDALTTSSLLKTLASQEEPRKNTNKKRPLRRSRSFTCSAKDFVPRRTDRFEDHYDIVGERLGEGAFGEVFVCVSKASGDERAVKILRKESMNDWEREDVLQEFQMLKSMDHPNVIRMYEFYDTADSFYIVQELVKGGELYDVLEESGTLPEQETVLLMKQVLSCVKYLAQNSIVHRDLNLENVLLENGGDYESLRVIDFGLATTFRDDEKLTDLVGKTHYLAPEVLEQQYGPKYDVYCCGVIAYILLCGFAPFDADSDADIRQLIMEGHVSFDDPEWEHVSDEAKDFVAMLLTYKEEDRPTAEEALCHPWIANAIKQSQRTFRKRHSTVAGDALFNMRSFSATSKLKKAACSFIASQLLQKGERGELDRIFRGMDDDCDGQLSVDDLQASYKEFSDSKLSEEEMEELFENCNMSGTGFISYSEFIIASMRSSDLLDEKRLRAAFDNFDTDKTGFISAENLKESLASCQSASADEIVDKIIQQVDRGNGLISFADFQDIMTQNSTSNGTERTADDDISIECLSCCNEEDTGRSMKENAFVCMIFWRRL